MKKRLTTFFLSFAIAISFLFSSCTFFKSDEDKIIERIEKFEKSYNDGDMDGVLECLTAKEKRILQAQLNIFETLIGGLTGFSLSLSDLFSFGVGLVDFNMIEITVGVVTLTSDEKATVEATMFFTQDLSGELEVCPVLFYMLKEENDWFIKDIIDVPKEETSENSSDVENK